MLTCDGQRAHTTWKHAHASGPTIQTHTNIAGPCHMALGPMQHWPCYSMTAHTALPYLPATSRHMRKVRAAGGLVPALHTQWLYRLDTRPWGASRQAPRLTLAPIAPACRGKCCAVGVLCSMSSAVLYVVTDAACMGRARRAWLHACCRNTAVVMQCMCALGLAFASICHSMHAHMCSGLVALHDRCMRAVRTHLQAQPLHQRKQGCKELEAEASSPQVVELCCHWTGWTSTECCNEHAASN